MLICERVDDEFFELGVGVKFKAQGLKGPVQVTHQEDRHIACSVQSIELLGSHKSNDVHLWSDLWARAKRRIHGQVRPVSIKPGVNIPWAHTMRSHFHIQPQPWQLAAFKAVEEQNRCVFVTAPTGAGKTQVAMSAVSTVLSLKDPSACLIYVAPTTALANQIFIDVLVTVSKLYPKSEQREIRTHVQQMVGINTQKTKLHTSAQVIITVPKTVLTWLQVSARHMDRVSRYTVLVSRHNL
jgi:superfamily II RNA helicase